MPEKILRVKTYNRVSRSRYIMWLSGKIGVQPTDEVFKLPTRNSIDNLLESLIKPSWVEVAEGVINQDIEEEVDAPADIDLGTDAQDVPEEPSDDEIDDTEIIDTPFSLNINYDSMTVRELQDVCRERNLTIRGTKAEVVLRLKRDDEGISEIAPEESEPEAPLEEAAEVTLDTPVEETAVTEDVTKDDKNSEQKPNTDEEE